MHIHRRNDGGRDVGIRFPMRAVGWIPGFGVLIAAVWSMVATINGFGAALDMRGGAAAGCGILGLVVVAIILVVLGIV